MKINGHKHSLMLIGVNQLCAHSMWEYAAIETNTTELISVCTVGLACQVNFGEEKTQYRLKITDDITGAE